MVKKKKPAFCYLPRLVASREATYGTGVEASITNANTDGDVQFFFNSTTFLHKFPLSV